MKILIKPKADWRVGYMQWGVMGKHWRIFGWFWPLGFRVKFNKIDFTWYSKRFLKGRGATVYFLGHKVHWYGVIL